MVTLDPLPDICGGEGDQESALSIIVTIVSGSSILRNCLTSLTGQMSDGQIEVIVPYDSAVEGIEHLRSEFPQIDFIDLGTIQTRARRGSYAAAHEIYDRCRAVGLKAARGNILALLDDSCTPESNWCQEVLKAHRLGHSAIGGAVEHAGKGVLNWAVYFRDFGRYQLPLPEGPTAYLTDVNLSYKRHALESVREQWSESYNEVTVNWALSRRGAVLWMRPQMVVYQDRGALKLYGLVKERFSWGRLFASTRLKELTFVSRMFYIGISPIIPLVLLARTSGKVISGRRNLAQFSRALPAQLLLNGAWCIGEFVGYVTGRSFPG